MRNAPSVSKTTEKILCRIFNLNYINCKYSHRLSTLPEDKFFKEITEKISENPSRTYIHCEYGKRRTGVVVAYYEKEQNLHSQQEIIQNMIRQGFYDLNDKTGKRIERYKKILAEFISRYCPEAK